MLEAAQFKDRAEIKSMFNSQEVSVDTDTIYKYGHKTPLMVAVICKNEEGVDALLSLGAE